MIHSHVSVLHMYDLNDAGCKKGLTIHNTMVLYLLEHTYTYFLVDQRQIYNRIMHW